MSLNTELAGLFERMAQIMEIKGANPFKSIAFHKVARVLRDLTVDIKQCCADGTIKEIQGIGEGGLRSGVAAQILLDPIKLAPHLVELVFGLPQPVRLARVDD